MKKPQILKRLNVFFPPIPGGGVPGAALMREVPHPAARHAFRVYRALMSWALALPEERKGMFTDGGMHALAVTLSGARGIPESLRQPLISIACELATDPPDVEQLQKACIALTDWAIQQRAAVSVLAFADAAASITPDARYAYIAGRLHRQAGSLHQAERWLRMSSTLSGRERDWETKARSLLALGVAFLNAGKYKRAHTLFKQGLNRVARHRIGHLRGEAWHNLFMVSAALCDFKDADSALREAAVAYGRGHIRLPYFAHDLAVYSLDREDARSALSVLLALLDRYWLDEPESRLLAYGTTLRALGGCGNNEVFDEIHADLLDLLAQVPETPRQAQALLAAARGALSLQRWENADSLLTRALESAIRTKQRDTALKAEELLMTARHDHAGNPEPYRRSRPYGEVARLTVLALERSGALS